MADRKQFKTINFATAPASLQPAEYTAAINSLALAFWGREATTAELASFDESRTLFVSGADPGRAATQKTNALMVMVCTGMLASFDSYTL